MNENISETLYCSHCGAIIGEEEIYDTIDGEIVCDYDRGWDVRPTCKAAEVALEILLYEYDGRNEE